MSHVRSGRISDNSGFWSYLVLAQNFALLLIFFFHEFFSLPWINHKSTFPHLQNSCFKDSSYLKSINFHKSCSEGLTVPSDPQQSLNSLFSIYLISFLVYFWLKKLPIKRSDTLLYSYVRYFLQYQVDLLYYLSRSLLCFGKLPK